MGTLERTEIFAVGTWNDSTFTEQDLDELVEGFEAEALAGRVPVKLGHTAPDTDPARGWLTRVWREGDKLLARIEQVPDDVIAGIKSGAWRYVSVELLRNFTSAAGQTYRWLLDGLALLGSARPAVEGLAPLHASSGAARYAFTYAATPKDDAAALRRENAALRAQQHRERVEHDMESYVRAGMCMAAAREHFTKLFRLSDDESFARVTVSDWRAFAATQPRPPSRSAATHSTSAARQSGLPPDTAMVERVRAYLRENEVRHFQLTGERLTFDRAAAAVVREVARTEPALLRSYIEQPGVTD